MSLAVAGFPIVAYQLKKKLYHTKGESGGPGGSPSLEKAIAILNRSRTIKKSKKKEKLYFLIYFLLFPIAYSSMHASCMHVESG